jgi:hypothetical protein
VSRFVDIMNEIVEIYDNILCLPRFVLHVRLSSVVFLNLISLLCDFETLSLFLATIKALLCCNMHGYQLV